MQRYQGILFSGLIGRHLLGVVDLVGGGPLNWEQSERALQHGFTAHILG